MQEAINELSRLYRLKNEGKKVDTLIKRVEDLLFSYCEYSEQEQLAAETADAKNN